LSGTEDRDALPELFEALAAMTPTQRARRLALLEPDNAALMTAMLAVDDSAISALPEVPFADLAHRWDGLQPGTRLGSFELQRMVGHGGMGQVYLGRRVGDVQQQVAIKVQLPLVSSEETLRRFRLERQMLASLEHPAIARLIECGEDAHGRPYFAMEWVDGLAIDAWCDQARLDLDARLQLFISLCEGVDYAHRHLVVHRDIKASNVMVSRDGQPKLLDFGIAKELDGNASTSEQTATHARFFSPHNAAPEQVRGTAVGVSCDVYALGALLYQLLAGLRPYELQGLSPADIEQQICERAPPPPSARVAALHGSDGAAADVLARQRGVARASALVQALRGDLDRIVLHALRKRPEERYASAAALAGDLRRFLDGEPVLAQGMGRIYRARRFVGRHRLATGLVSGLVLSLAVFAAVLWRQAAELRAERDEVARQLVRVDQERRHAEQVTGFIEQTFALVDPNRILGRKLSVDELLDTAVRTLDYTRVDAPELKHRMQMSVVKVMLSLGRHVDAAAILADTPPALPPSAQFERGRMRAEAALAAGDAALAERASAEAIERLAQWPDADEATRVRGWLTRARALRTAQPRDALAAIELAVAGIARLRTTDNELVSPVSRLRAHLLIALGDRERGRDELQALLRTQRTTLPAHHPSLLETLRLLSVLATEDGDLKTALGFIEEQLASAEKVFGADSLRVAYALNARGNTRLEQGDAAGAIADYSRCLSLLIAKTGASHPHVALTYYNRGEAARLIGADPIAAERDYRSALAVAPASDPPPAVHALFRLGLGSTLLEQGRWAEAERELDQALAVGAKAHPGGSFHAQALGERALFDLRRGDVAAARLRWSEATAMFRQSSAPPDQARRRLERALGYLGSQ